jgi:hypothetical protein
VAAAAIVCAALVALGRFERSDWVDGELDGMADALALVGPLDSPSLSGYRVRADFDCLAYRRGANALALEVCVDGGGRVVETIDRRRPERRIHSLRADPAASDLHVDRGEVDRLLIRMGAEAAAGG